MARRHLALTTGVRLAVTMGACWLLFAWEAAAAVFVVNSTQDDTDLAVGNGICATFGSQVCTLRAAIQETNALPGPDIINLPAGYYLTNIGGAGEDAAATGDLDILGDLTILGAGADTVIIDVDDLDRIFHILPGRTVLITGVTLLNGVVAGNGGGVLNELSVLTIRNSAIIGNAATATTPGFGARGGGIFNSGTLTVTGSTIANNIAQSGGGGIYNLQFGSATVVNSTISDNSRDGVFIDGVTSLSVSNSTITDNSNGSPEVWSSSNSGSAVFQNTILSGPNGGCGGNTAGFVSNGHNLESDNTCNFSVGVGDRVLTAPLLDLLQSNGGSTPTRAPQAGSPAIDGGSPLAPGSGAGACELTDQRGTSRPIDGDGNGTSICDIGAVEVGVGSPPTDTVPDAFTFTDQTGAARSTVISSNTITVSGIDAPAPISVSGGEYSVNGGAFTATAGNVVNGNTVNVRHTSSASFATATNTTLTIGGVSDTFTSTTLAQDTTPDAFSFVDQTGVAVGTSISSNTVTVAGINTPTPISITGGEYSVNGGAFTAAAGTVSAGNTVRVRLTSSSASNTQVTATVTIGGVNGAFRVTTVLTTVTVVAVKGGGGAVDWWFVLCLAGLLAFRARAMSRSIAMLLAAIAFLPVSQAAERGIYLAAGGGHGTVSTDAAALESRLEAITADSITSITLDDTHTSWHARFGFELNQRFSLEAAYYDFGNVTGNIQANATNPTAFAAPVPAEFPRDPHGPALQARVRWPIADETALAVRAGMIRWSSDQRAQLVTGGTGAFEDSDDDTDVVWGVELAWQRWRRFGLVLELNGAKDDSSARSLDLGLVWKLR